MKTISLLKGWTGKSQSVRKGTHQESLFFFPVQCEKGPRYRAIRCPAFLAPAKNMQGFLGPLMGPTIPPLFLHVLD